MLGLKAKPCVKVTYYAKLCLKKTLEGRNILAWGVNPRVRSDP